MSTPRFKFGLERVRELRAHDEDRAKEAFAASLEQRVRGAALLADVSRRLDDAQAAQRDAFTRSGAELASTQAWLEQVERSRQDAERRLRHHDAEVLERRGELTEASRRRQALDKLKERRAAEHALDAQRREGAFLEDIALSAHVRKGAA